VVSTQQRRLTEEKKINLEEEGVWKGGITEALLRWTMRETFFGNTYYRETLAKNARRIFFGFYNRKN